MVQNSRKGKNMSSPAPAQSTGLPEKEITKKFKIFDVDSFSIKEETKTFKFQPAATSEEAIKRLGNDEKVLVEALNEVLEHRTIIANRPAGVSKKAVLDFIKGWRNAEPYRSMVKKNKGDEGWKTEYNAQTDSIFAAIKNIPPMVELIKNLPSGGDEEETEE